MTTPVGHHAPLYSSCRRGVIGAVLTTHFLFELFPSVQTLVIDYGNGRREKQTLGLEHWQTEACKALGTCLDALKPVHAAGEMEYSLNRRSVRRKGNRPQPIERNGCFESGVIAAQAIGPRVTHDRHA